MNPARVRERGIRFTHAEGGTLSGYRLLFDKTSNVHPGTGHASLELCRTSRVEGVLYWLEVPEEITKMDRFEKTPVNYSREMVAITAASSEQVIWSWTYFANPAVRKTGLKPPRSYLEHLLAGRDFLSESYVAVLAGTPCEEDR